MVTFWKANTIANVTPFNDFPLGNHGGKSQYLRSAIHMFAIMGDYETAFGTVPFISNVPFNFQRSIKVLKKFHQVIFKPKNFAWMSLVWVETEILVKAYKYRFWQNFNWSSISKKICFCNY